MTGEPILPIVLLFSVATAVSVVTRRLHVPYTVALVLAGLGLGATKLVSGVHLTRELLFAVFLPGLLFEAAYHLEWKEFRQNARAILALAIPGVVVAIGATATLLTASASGLGIGWPLALVFAALIAATDPIAVVALFKTLGAPKRLGVLIEGESLVNDGTAVVLFTIIYESSTTGGLHPGSALLEFARVAGMGLVVGAAVGFFVTHVMKRIDDPLVELTLTVIAAYGSFGAAEELHFSGVIATVTAGMFCGSYAAPRAMSKTTRSTVEAFWEYVAFALNSLVFLLIGAEVSLRRVLAAWLPIVLAFLAVTVGRAVVVTLAYALLRGTKEAHPFRFSVMLTWGGLRGALSMVLALSIPASFPQRELLVTMTFGVVLISIVLQGVTCGPLLRWLKLATQAPTVVVPLVDEQAHD